MKISSKGIGKVLTLTMIMLFSLSVSVFAANVAKIGTTEYPTFAEAISTATTGDTITLLSEVDLGNTATYLDGTNDYAINIANKAITLELNGYVLKSTVGYATLRINSDAELTVQDSSSAKTGAILNNASGGEAIRSYGTLTINSGKIGTEMTHEMYSLILENNSKTTINDGTFNGTVYTNGSRVNNCELTIKNGTYTGMLYLAGAGTYVIENGNFSIANTYDNAVIELERGSLTIKGGTFEFDVDTSANSTSTELNGNGSGYYKGTVIVSRIVGSTAAAEETTLTIEGGEYTNNLGDALVTVNKSTDNATLTVNVSDATITGNVSDYNTEEGNDETTIQNTTVVEINPVAQVNNSKFNTFAEAIEYAEDGDTVTLLTDVDLGSVATYLDGTNDYAINIAGKAITLELDGHVLESTVGYATIRVNSDAELTVQDSSSAKTGAILNNANGGEAIRSYGTLTVNSGKIGTESATGMYSLILENNTTTIINDGIFNGIIYTNGIRVDACELTINNGTFTGMLYLAGAGTYTIENGNFSMDPAVDNAIIEIERGELTINGGTFEMNVDSATNNSSASNNGNASGGYQGTIIVSKGNTTTGGDVSLVVTGGTFTNNLGEAFVMANESTSLVSTIEITDATVTGDIAYYGLKSSDSTEPVITENNITLKGTTAENNEITVYARAESKEEVEKNSVKTLQTKPVTVTFVFENGEADKVVSGNYGDALTAPADPTRRGYEFTGWDKEIPATLPYEDTTITAKWKLTAPTSDGNTSSGGTIAGGNTNNNKYRITVGQKDGGTISPATIKVEKGESQKFVIKANEGYIIKDVIVDGKSIGAVEEYEFKDVNSTHSITAKFEKVYDDTEDWENPYNDVDEDDWFYDAVKFVNSNGLFNGVSYNTYAPSTNMTRGMIVTVLYRHAKEDVTGDSIFTDVDSSMYYNSPIAWAAVNGIVNGIGNDLFAPEKEITREQLVAILYRYAKFMDMDVSVGEDTNILSYDDVNEVSEYAIEAFQWACGSGVVTGRTNSTLVPQGTATRAEVATMIMRFCNL